MSHARWNERLEQLRKSHLMRELTELENNVGPAVVTEGGPKILFCSNDYLGLASHPEVKATLQEGIRKWGAGTASSRLVSGHTRAHRRLEQRVAQILGTEDAVLFSSGYQANVGALSCLTGAGDIIFSDRLVHASIIDGCRLSRAQVVVYRHRDANHLAKLLEEHKTDGVRLIVSDAVFSMDGDTAPLEPIVALAHQHDASVYLDEAHSFGVMGPGGRGLAAQVGLEDQVALRLITLGKSLGLMGAVIATTHTIADLIRSSARSLMYTTASPAAWAEAAIKSINLVEKGDELRDRLTSNIILFKKQAAAHDLPVPESDTAIQPFIVGDAAKTMRVSQKLRDRGILVQGIRPPTVPEGSSRLRITLSAFHEAEHIEFLISELTTIAKEEEL